MSGKGTLKMKKPPVQEPPKQIIVPKKTEAAKQQKKVKELNSKVSSIYLDLDNAMGKINKYREKWGMDNLSLTEFVATVAMAGGNYQEIIVAQLSLVGKSLKKLEKLEPELEKAGLYNFFENDDYMNLYGQKEAFETLVELGKETYKEKKKNEENWLKKGPPGEIKTFEGPIKEVPPTLKLFPSTTELFMYGPGEVYIDSSCGSNPVNKSTFDLCRAIEAGEVEAFQGLNEFTDSGDFIYLIPVIGPAYGVVQDIQSIQKKGPTIGNVAMLALDVTFIFVDAKFVIHMTLKTGAKLSGRKVGTALLEGGSAAKQAEKDVFAKAVTELDKKEVQALFDITKAKGSWAAVVDDLALKAGKQDITADLMKAYISQYEILVKKTWKVKAIESLWKDFDIIGKDKFRKKMLATFYDQLSSTLHFDSIKEIGALLKKSGLTKKQEKTAVNAIFYTIMSFDKKAQKAFLQLVKEKGWKYVVNNIDKKILEFGGEKAAKAGKDVIGEGTRAALAEMVPEYRIAYISSPIEHWVNFGIFLIGAHTGMLVLGEFVRAETEKVQKEYEKTITNLSEVIETIAGGLENQEYITDEAALREQFAEGYFGE